MIVRVSGEAQYELPDGDAARLNEIDNETTAAVEAGDEAGFHEGGPACSRSSRPTAAAWTTTSSCTPT